MLKRNMARGGAVLGAAGIAIAVLAGCSEDGEPAAESTTTTAASATESSVTESTPAESSATSAAPTAIPEQKGAATPPMEMTCGTYLALTPEQQQAAAVAIATERDNVLAKSNENTYRLVATFCEGQPDSMLKDNMMLQ